MLGFQRANFLLDTVLIKLVCVVLCETMLICQPDRIKDISICLGPMMAAIVLLF